jgi:hypothetical protein
VSNEGTPEEREVHFGPGGPVEAAKGWLDDVVIRRDVRAGWKRMDPDYRLALTQAIIFLNDQNPLLQPHKREALALELSEAAPEHPLWDAFAELLAEEFLQDLGEINVRSWDVITPRPVGPGYELVLFAHPGGEGGAAAYPGEGEPEPYPPEMTSHGVLMHLRDGRWLVAGLSERPAVPGWPPDLGY